MDGKKRGVMILKNGGELGNVGGNLISNMIEFKFLKNCHGLKLFGETEKALTALSCPL